MVYAMLRRDYVWETELTHNPTWSQASDARAMNVLNRKHDSNARNQPFSPVLGKNGLVFVIYSEANRDVSRNEDLGKNIKL